MNPSSVSKTTMVIFFSRFYFDTTVVYLYFTGKSLSEALMFASTNPQYDDRLFIELQVQYTKIPSSNLGRTFCVQKLFLTVRTIFVHNMFSPCSAKRRASDKDLPVHPGKQVHDCGKCNLILILAQLALCLTFCI